MLICIHGLFPSDNLWPCDDVFPIEPKQLYKEFDVVTELDILGVLPYGDKDLIECIARGRLAGNYEKFIKGQAGEVKKSNINFACPTRCERWKC